MKWLKTHFSMEKAPDYFYFSRSQHQNFSQGRCWWCCWKAKYKFL